MDSEVLPRNPENAHNSSVFSKHYPNSPLHLSSEWDDAYIENRMTTVTQVETPSKKPRTVPVHLVTPGKPNTSSTPMQRVVLSRYSTAKADLAAPTPPPEPRSPKKVHMADVFWAMLNDITGKDKMAKFGQYTLRLLLHHSKKAQDTLSDDVVNVKMINRTYKETDRMMHLVMNFIQNPRAFARIIAILVCLVFRLRFQATVPMLGMYRQFLRFGKSPFRIRALLRKIADNTYQDAATKAWKISDKLFSNATLGEAVSLYYLLNDEALLLYKLKLLRNAPLRKIVGRHESYAWYCDLWLALYNLWASLQRLSNREMEVKILIQVKKRARALLRQMLGGTALDSELVPEDESADAQMLREIQFRKTNALLDVWKTLSDIVFNSYTVFGMALHFDTIQIWMGISASTLSCIKLFREKRRLLVKDN